MGYTKIGVATCISFVDLAKTLSGILQNHGFEVASVASKHGGVPKEDMTLEDAEKIQPDNFEAMCNPVSQAKLLNEFGCQFNVVLACVSVMTACFSHTPKAWPPP